MLNAETKPIFLRLPYAKQRNFFFFTEKRLFKEKGEWRVEQKKKKKKEKKDFLTALATKIKKEPATSIRKHANVCKIHKKISRKAMEQDYAI